MGHAGKEEGFWLALEQWGLVLLLTLFSSFPFIVPGYC